jgi:hypothetical protein
MGSILLFVAVFLATALLVVAVAWRIRVWLDRWAHAIIGAVGFPPTDAEAVEVRHPDADVPVRFFRVQDVCSTRSIAGERAHEAVNPAAALRSKRTTLGVGSEMGRNQCPPELDRDLALQGCGREA